MTRREFSAKVKLLAYKRACQKPYEPHCEICGKRILGLCEYDHAIPDGLGGEPTLENCQVLCGSCHRAKTNGEDRPVMAKADRQMKAAAGIKRKWKWPKRGFFILVLLVLAGAGSSSNSAVPASSIALRSEVHILMAGMSSAIGHNENRCNPQNDGENRNEDCRNGHNVIATPRINRGSRLIMDVIIGLLGSLVIVGTVIIVAVRGK